VIQAPVFIAGVLYVRPILARVGHCAQRRSRRWCVFERWLIATETDRGPTLVHFGRARLVGLLDGSRNGCAAQSEEIPPGQVGCGSTHPAGQATEGSRRQAPYRIR
jgi:hypothetical protein